MTRQKQKQYKKPTFYLHILMYRVIMLNGQHNINICAKYVHTLQLSCVCTKYIAYLQLSVL